MPMRACGSAASLARAQAATCRHCDGRSGLRTRTMGATAPSSATRQAETTWVPACSSAASSARCGAVSGSKPASNSRAGAGHWPACSACRSNAGNCAAVTARRRCSSLCIWPAQAAKASASAVPAVCRPGSPGPCSCSRSQVAATEATSACRCGRVAASGERSMICCHSARACRSLSSVGGRSSTSAWPLASHADHVSTSAAGHTRRPARCWRSSYSCFSARARRRLGASTVTPAASASRTAARSTTRTGSPVPCMRGF